MIRFFSLLARRPDVSSQEFHDHWRHPHGTMGRQIPGLRSYVQAHRIATPAVAEPDSTVEGVAISGFDSMTEARGLLHEPQYTDKVQPDEQNFQDFDHNAFLCTHEEVLVPRASGAVAVHPADSQWYDLNLPVSVQLLQFVRADADGRWSSDADAELGAAVGAFRHARNTVATEWHDEAAAFVGVRQLWWPTLSHLEAGLAAAPDAFDRLVAQAGDALTLVTSSERWLR